MFSKSNSYQLDWNSLHFLFKPQQAKMKFILVYKVFNDQISSEIKGDLNFWSVHCMMCERKMKFNHLM